MRLSIVIPTYKRPESLNRLLLSLVNQSFLPDEILVVSGDQDSINESQIRDSVQNLSIEFYYTRPSVCVQRNKGIIQAKGDMIALFDDDIEPESNYLETLVGYLDHHPNSQVACGLFLEKRNNKWTAEFPPQSVLSLLYKRIFHHAVWGSLNDIPNNLFNRGILHQLRKYYADKGNGLTKAGWPLVTDLSEDVNACQIYSLGASIFRAESIKGHLFDEILESSGIGDNYGVSLSLGEDKPIMVLKGTAVQHHKESKNRMLSTKSYVLRILAMDYFLKMNDRKTFYVHILLFWSLIGSLIAQFLKLKLPMALASMKVFIILLLGINPYKQIK